MWCLQHANEVIMNDASEIVVEDAKLAVSFALGRNKTAIVVGTYAFKETSNEDRLKFLGIVHQFGQELSGELSENYGATIMKIVLCEVDPGHIMFEIETSVSASIRRKAIEAVQHKFEQAIEAAEQSPQQQHLEPLPDVFPMNGPDTLQ